MGQKIHPKSIRLGIHETWDSKWFVKGREYARLLTQDHAIKEYLCTRLKETGLDHVEFSRTPQSLTIEVALARPGVVIGRGGAGAEALRQELKKKFGIGKKSTFNLNIVEVKNPSLSAHIVIQDMINDIEKRMPFRRVLKHSVDRIMKAGAKGVRVAAGGRLDGAEIARREKLTQGSLPLHTLRAHIDYAQGTAHTIYGTIGIKVWIYKGQVFSAKGVPKPTGQENA